MAVATPYQRPWLTAATTEMRVPVTRTPTNGTRLANPLSTASGRKYGTPMIARNTVVAAAFISTRLPMPMM